MSGEVRYPGWCCHQIAAQLSQALFTMADLHAQISDLREENRQLKMKVETVDFIKSEEVLSPARDCRKLALANAVPVIPSLSDSVQSAEEAPKKTSELRIPKSELKLEQEFLRSSLRGHNDLLSMNSNRKQERINLSIPSNPNSDDNKVESATPTTSQFTGDFRCDKCECSFSNSDQLTSHQTVHLGRSFHICKVCNAMFLLKADLHRHFTTHPDIKQHICQLCGKAYTSKNNYKLHIKTHTGVGLYPCEVCGKAFHSENHLNVHLRIHTGERPYECQYCDKSFTQKSGLINHTRLHTGEKPFLCPSCPKAFTQKSNLNFHLSKHHPIPGNAAS